MLRQIKISDSVRLQVLVNQLRDLALGAIPTFANALDNP